MGDNSTRTPAPLYLVSGVTLDPPKVSLSSVTGAAISEQEKKKVAIGGLEEPQNSLHNVLNLV